MGPPMGNGDLVHKYIFVEEKVAFFRCGNHLEIES